MSSKSENKKKRKCIKQNSSDSLLISKNFFSPEIKIDYSKAFPMIVMATMSSGKSTLINALLGHDILPSKNEACTSKIYAILDDDTAMKPKMFITDCTDNVRVITKNISQEMECANSDSNVKEIFVRGQITGVINTEKSLLILDTPGPNNSQESNHERITKHVLEHVHGGLILYVLNSTQLGINDDKNLLNSLSTYLSKHSKSKVLFILNKVDEIDDQKESIENIVLLVKKYLQNNGFKQPEIIPVSALAASLFKKALSGDHITRKQYKNFLYYYDLFKSRGLDLKSYAITNDLNNQYDRILIKKEEYKVSDLVNAIDNTGITYLEKFIQKEQILSSN